MFSKAPASKPDMSSVANGKIASYMTRAWHSVFSGSISKPFLRRLNSKTYRLLFIAYTSLYHHVEGIL